LKIEYAGADLEKLCTNEAWLRRKRGDLAKRLPLRIKALEAARTVGELAAIDPLGRWHELTADRPGHWAGKLTDNWRLIMRPEGHANLRQSKHVTVVDITDYH